MAWVLRFRKLCYVEPAFQSFEPCSKVEQIKPEDEKLNLIRQKKKKYTIKREDNSNNKERRCIDSCCRIIGCICTTWWLLLFLFNSLSVGFHVTELPGVRLKREEGLTALHPVVLVPGIVTGGLELWEGRPCAGGLFRKRLWGGSFAEIFKRPLCWLDHISLDNETGLDPPGIRVRPVPGLVAGDYFAPGYFVWAILIENLAKIGYEGKNMHMAAYDWRLSFQNTDMRDKALSRLKSKIELMYVTNGNKKVVVVPHSMGVIYFLHFLKWVETPPPMGDGGGLGWCDKYIKAIMNIGPVFLGVPKAVSNLFSAEGKDVAYVRDVWTEYDEISRESIGKVTEIQAYTAKTLLDLLRFVSPKMMKRAEAHFSHGIADDLKDIKYGHYKLPEAPTMEIYCMYGVGIPTERSYVYKKSPTDKCKNIPFRIDSSINGEDQDSCLQGGVYFVDGDESVPVLSAGYMCVKGWKGKTRFNPSGTMTYTREYRHKPPTSFLEGRGLQSGSHVDIMGNVDLIEDVLRVAVGSTGSEIGGDKIFSDIITMSEKINLRL